MYTLEQLKAIHKAAIIDFNTVMRTGLNSVHAESARDLSAKMIERMNKGDIPEDTVDMLEQLIRKSIIVLLDHNCPSSLLTLDFLPEDLITESLFDDPNDSRVNGDSALTASGVNSLDDSAMMFEPIIK